MVSDLLACHVLDGRRAGAHRLVVDEHGAGAAQRLAAPELRAGQAEVVAQHPQQHALVVDRQPRGLAVEREGHRSHQRSLRAVAPRPRRHSEVSRRPTGGCQSPYTLGVRDSGFGTRTLARSWLLEHPGPNERHRMPRMGGFMDAARLRAWWWQRQGLDGSLEGKSAAEVLDRAGWARSVGGANPYLTLFARAGLGRAGCGRRGGGARYPRTAERARLHVCRAGDGLRPRAGRRPGLRRRRNERRAEAGGDRQGCRPAVRHGARGAGEGADGPRGAEDRRWGLP